MSHSPEEYAYDDYMAQLQQEIADEAIREFADELLKSYYIGNKLLAAKAFNSLSKAQTLSKVDPTAAFLFSVIALETGVAETLLKPIVFGLVHQSSIAKLIVKSVFQKTSSPISENFKELIVRILCDHGGIDLGNLRREGSEITLWLEIDAVRKLRNKVVHEAEEVSKDKADNAFAVASYMLESVFPAVIKKMGLHLHDQYKICDDWKCKT